jgi:hypothetical protein
MEQEKGLKIGIDTPLKHSEKVSPQILQAYRVLTKPLSIIREYIPEVKGIKSSFCFKLMVIIACNERITEGCIRAILNGAKESSVRPANNRLISLGYIREVNKPRLIIPFQAYKIDKGYMITPKGKSALNKMLDY